MENEKEDDDHVYEDADNPVSALIIIAGLQHLSEIRKVLSSVENAGKMFGYLNEIENFLAERHCFQ